MKNTLLHFLEQLGVPLNYVINGLIGGFIWSIYKKEKFWSSVRQIVIGGVIAGYFTPVIIARTDLSSPYIGFTSFIIGMLGMVLIDSFYKYALKWLKKFKKIEEVLKKD
jgi:hypothetical protein